MALAVEDLFSAACRLEASDVHLTAGAPAMLRVRGMLVAAAEAAANELFDGRESLAELLAREPRWAGPLSAADLQELAASLLGGDGTRRDRFLTTGSCDLAYQIPGQARFRVNVYRQRGSPAVAARRLSFRVPGLRELFGHQPGLAETVAQLASLPRGLVLVTGATGSGKSTTLAAMVVHAVSQVARHVITLEDPIEYLIAHGRGLVNQRQVGEDVPGFAEGLRAALREDPDVIVVGEMRDPETIAAALTAAETGHLVLSTLHTRTAAAAVTRVVDAFPQRDRDQVRIQFAESIQGILAQQLLPRAGGGTRLAAVEVLLATPAVRAMIREGRVQEVPSAIQTGSQEGMVPMDRALADLVRAGLVSEEEARERCVVRQLFDSYLGGWFRVQ